MKESRGLLVGIEAIRERRTERIKPLWMRKERLV